MENQQQVFLRRARKALKVNTEELSELVGCSLSAMRRYFLPEASKTHRRLPEPTRRLLERLVQDARAAKRKR